MGFSLDSLNPFDSGHVLDFSGNSGWQGVGNSLGLGQAPGQTPYQVNQGAFQNPAGNFGPQLGGAIGGFRGAAGGPVTAAASPYTAQGTQGQLGLAGTYAAMAAGQGPSLADVQAKQQGASNLQQAESMLGSSRGAGSPAAAQLSAANALTGGQQQVAQNAVQGRTAEEMGALGAMGGLYGNVSGTGLAQQGQQNQVAQGNQANTLAVQNAYLQALAAQNAQQQQGAMAGQQLGAQSGLGYGQLASQDYNQSAGRRQQFLGSMMQGGAGVASAALGA